MDERTGEGTAGSNVSRGHAPDRYEKQGLPRLSPRQRERELMPSLLFHPAMPLICFALAIALCVFCWAASEALDAAELRRLCGDPPEDEP